ncbi:Unannotated [Lentimonas sp. CC19]|nr:Unannotated [Lentimonas sp. CC19]CAA6697691.1 Unannotated [Lentimonas sp. CC10]CAA7070571.1 Unannotated [Lentimonas sp. CC11]
MATDYQKMSMDGIISLFVRQSLGEALVELGCRFMWHLIGRDELCLVLQCARASDQC